MKRATILFCLIVMYISDAISQDYTNLIEQNFSWESYEQKVSKQKKTDIIGNLTDDLIDFIRANDLLESYKDSFHVIDFDKDGMPDLIYSGLGGADSYETILYRNTSEGYKKIFHAFGKIINLWYTFPCSPICFMVLHYPFDPPDILRNLDVYVPVFNEERYSIDYKFSSRLSFIENTFFPERLNLNIPFIVKNDSYKLRLAPIIDEEKDYFDRDRKGNTIAEYSEGATGIALAEKTDYTGRVWWFVIMLNNIEPQNSFFSNLGSNINCRYLSLGWMSSRYLEEIE